MKHKAFNLLLSLAIVLGIAACGEKPVPTETVSATGLKQTAPPSDNSMAGEIARLMAFYEETGQFGGVMLVAQDGNIIYKDAFGWANLEWAIPNALDTRFRIASITKEFTAVLVMQQVEKGRLRLDGKVSEYLPDYPQRNGDRITIHHLLTHTAGIIDYEHLFAYLGRGGSVNVAGFDLQVSDGETTPDYLNVGRLPHTHQDLLGHFADKDLLFSPGSGLQYSNFGYTLLAIILEQVTGQSYQELLQEGILDPVGMENTGIDVNSSILERRASGYYYRPLAGLENSAFLDMSIALGSGSLYSTVEDLFLFNQAIYSGQLLSDDSLDRMMRAGYVVASKDYPYEYGPLTAVGGTGAINGFNNSVQRLTGGNGVQFVAVLSNYRNGDAQVGVIWPDTVARQIAAIINDLEYDPPTISAASVVGQAVMESGADAASRTMTDLFEDADSTYRFEEIEFLLVADRLAELEKRDEACQVLESYVGDSYFKTAEIRQKLAEYCE
jgi:CubicO group peptidase (beta-lactamase class C family)